MLGQPFADWLYFPRLDGGAGVQSAFTLAYKITDDSAEHWSERFVRFKNKDKVACIGAASVMRQAVPRLFGELGLDRETTVIVSALSSSETTANPKRAIPAIATLCGGLVGMRVANDAVTKQVHGRIHDIGSPAARDAELERALYEVAPLGARTVVVFDDFITRGATLSRIAQAVQANNPGTAVIGVALGKTERAGYWGEALSNNGVPAQWDQLWLAGEQAYHAKHG